MMRAVRIHSYGGPEVMQVEELAGLFRARNRRWCALRLRALTFLMCNSAVANWWGRLSTGAPELLNLIFP